MCKSKAILKLTKTAKQLNMKLTKGDPGILFDGDCLLFEDPIGRLIPAEDDEDLGSHIPHSSIDDTMNWCFPKSNIIPVKYQIRHKLKYFKIVVFSVFQNAIIL